jgi:CheY-like chemotaxis protein
MNFNIDVHAGKTILLIDDNEIDLFINEKVINAKKTGAKVIKEISAKNAIDSFKKASTSKHIPDIIFVDLDMPSMNGFDFMEIFEKLPEKIIGNCKVFMLTSSTHEQDIKRAGEFKSIVKYLNKPLDIRELVTD